LALAFFRLFAISLIVLIVSFIGVLSLSRMGQDYAYTSAPHRLFDRDHLTIVAEGGKAFGSPYSEAALRAAAAAFPTAAIEIVTHPDASGIWRVGAPQIASPLTSSEHLSAVLARLSSTPVFLKIETGDPQMMATFWSAIESFDLDERLVVSSPSLRVLFVVKRERPLWLTAISAEHLLRDEIFASLGLASFARLPTDYVIVTPAEPNSRQLSGTLRSEINRRKIKLLLDETDPRVHFGEEWRRAAHGVLTSAAN
jgi:hypothetical protein